jgi:hypothetical protein
MLHWQRILLVAAILAATRGIVAVLSADAPQGASVVEAPALNQESGDRGQGTGDKTSNSARDSFTPSPEFQQWITNLVRQQLPENYEKRKNWGHTAKTFDGVSVRMENGQIKTHRKYREANDGQWQMYRVALKQPEEFDVKIANIRKLADGKVGMEITVDANLEVFGRQSQWEHGVQLYSVSAEADARVRLWAKAEVATHMELTRFPPDVWLEPQITAAKFEIPDFRMRRIGELHGPLVRSLSHTTREALEEKLADDNQKIVGKLNKAIDKQEKKLKLSLTDIMSSKWHALVGDQAPRASAGKGTSP